jgi:ribosomal protein S18 acetylase RimI-like enzyme
LAESAAGRAHLNLVDSSRRLFELDHGAVIDAADGRLLGAGSATHPVISNAAFRVDDGVDPQQLISEAREFFGGRGRGFALWVRGGVPEDRDLIVAAEAAGFKCAFEMPEMLLADRAEEPRLPVGAELRRLSTAEEAAEYWRIAATSYESIGFPPEAFGFYEGLERLAQEDAAAFLAYLDGVPVGIAMTIVNHGVAGIYWVGSLVEARGKGIGRAVTAAATNAGFDLGANVASLQASPMGEPIYRAMGFESAYDYRLLLSPAS